MSGYARRDKWAGAVAAARPVAHDDRSVMSKIDRSRPEQGITPRHAPGCHHHEGHCTCVATFTAQVSDARP